ncbi:MAG: hypothetical protein JNM88_16155 [Chitinophagaceae bacterium]|nr:hypothetical protein [Chitinophagaceae bacterium]
MKHLNKIVLALLLLTFLAACNRNNYSGGGSKKSKYCGCPGQKSNGGW